MGPREIRWDNGLSHERLRNISTLVLLQSRVVHFCTHALDDVATEAIWNICMALSMKAHTPLEAPGGPKKYHPKWRDIADAINGELGRQGEKILTSLPFRNLEEGTHVLTFPANDRRDERCTFTVQRHPQFGERDIHGGWRGIEYICSDDQTQEPVMIFRDT